MNIDVRPLANDLAQCSSRRCNVDRVSGTTLRNSTKLARSKQQNVRQGCYSLFLCFWFKFCVEVEFLILEPRNPKNASREMHCRILYLQIRV